MKKINYLLFLIPFLFGLNVFALDTNVTNKIKWSTNWLGGTYGGDDLTDGYNTIYPPFNVNQRYTGKLGYLEFFLSGDDYSFTTNHTYTITLNMATNDWRNNFMGPIVVKCNLDGSEQTTNSHLTVSNFRFISRKQIKFNFKTNSTLSPYYKFILYSNNYANKGGTAITGETNWNLSSIVISDNVSSGGSSGGTSTPTPTPTPSASNKDIIDNANQNTQNIIDNSTQNTTDIINNNNQNTQDIIDNQNNLLGNCDYQQISNINSVGSISTTDYYYETQPLDLQYFKKGSYYWGFNVSDLNMGGFIRLSATLLIWYSDGTPYQEINIDYNKNGSFVSEPFTINSDNVSLAYFRFLRTVVVDDTVKSGNFTNIFIGKYEKPIDFSFGSKKCTSRFEDVTNAVDSGANSIINSVNQSTQDINNGINDIKDSLTDETVPEIDLDLDLDTSSPVSDLLTMPITILNKVFDSTDNTCTPYVLPFDFTGGNNTLTFPCIDLKDYLGISVYNILDTILCFFFCYEIGMMCVSIYEDITSLHDGFDSLYTPKHGKPLGKHTKEVY